MIKLEVVTFYQEVEGQALHFIDLNVGIICNVTKFAEHHTYDIPHLEGHHIYDIPLSEGHCT